MALVSPTSEENSNEYSTTSVPYSAAEFYKVCTRSADFVMRYTHNCTERSRRIHIDNWIEEEEFDNNDNDNDDDD